MKKILSIIAILFVFPFVVNAADVKTFDAKLEDGVITISGTAEDGVYAVATTVYDKTGEALIAMQTTAVGEDLKFSDEIVVSKDDEYIVKAANYDGGDYLTVTVGEPSKFSVVAKDNTTEDKTAVKAVTSIIEKLVEDKEVSGVSKELKEKILDAIANDKTITVDLKSATVKEDDIKDDAKLVTGAINKEAKVAGYFDIVLNISIDGEVAGIVTVTEDKITVTLEVPKDTPKVADGYTRTYTVVRVHDEKAEKLDTKLNSDGTLSFETDKFSTYAITYQDTKNPKTGDMILTYVAILGISLVALGFGLKAYRNKTKKN